MIPERILHYRVLRRLGAGAAGEVHLARDERLARDVVLKFIPAAHAPNAERLARLEREARSLAALRHPNIAGVFALETAWEQPFLVMEYVDGETLDDVLRLGPLPVADVLHVGLALARALDHAHQRGVVHRDLKPENVLVGEDADVRLADFGIAASGGNGEGEIYGTAEYMSPEQARGEAVDGRSDLFSLGVVLYEALTGRRPFSGASPEELYRRICFAEPDPPSRHDPTVPEPLERLVLECLRKSPRDRPADAAAIAERLEALAGASPAAGAGGRAPAPARRPTRAALAVGLAAALALVLPSIEDRPRPRDTDTLVVLPVRVQGEGEDHDRVGRAFAGAIVQHLRRDREIRAVVPDTTARTAREAARWLLRGSLERRGGHLRASFQLRDSRSGRVMWESTRTAPDGELPLLASAVAHDLAVAMGAAPAHRYEYYLARIHSPVLAASPLTSEALGRSRRSDPGASEATRRLVEAFPNEPEALVLHAYALLGVIWETNARNAARDEFEATLRRLDRVDPRSPWPSIMRGSMEHRHGRLGPALAFFSSVADRDDLAVGARAFALALRGQAWRDADRMDLALADLEQAALLDATNDITLMILSEALRLAGRHDEAIERARMAAVLVPENAHTHYVLGLAYAGAERWIEADAALARACAMSPQHQSYAAIRALALLRTGRAAEARAEVARAERLPGSDWGDFMLSRYYAAAGEPDRALRTLRRSFDAGYRDPEIKTILEYASIRSRPGFVAMVDAIAERTRALSP